MAKIAADSARQVDPGAVIAAVSGGPNSTAFLSVVQQLKAFRANDSRVTYIYLVEKQNDTVRFLLTANYSMPDDAPFLSLYPDAPRELQQPVLVPTGAGPYTDSWGTFVSGFAPVNISPDTRVVILGVDTRI